jgi:hypothetical protein
MTRTRTTPLRDGASTEREGAVAVAPAAATATDHVAAATTDAAAAVGHAGAAPCPSLPEMTENVDLSTVAGLLADEHAQRILAATSVEPKSKRELADACDASLPTVGRRVDELAAVALLREATRARPDGHHDAVYVATLDRVEVRLRDGDLDVDLQRMERDMTDELQRLWRKF